MEFPETGLWVIDTSSIIAIKEIIKPQYRTDVFDQLGHLCTDGRLVYPEEVAQELKNGTKDGKPDPPYSWARENKKNGCRFGECYDSLVTVMNHPVARLTPDPNQTSGEDDADPHVLATALHVKDLGGSVVVVTEESRKIPPQVPLNVAAGSLGLPPINLHAFLIDLNIWTDDHYVNS